MTPDRDDENARALAGLLRESKEPSEGAPAWQRMGERRLLQAFQRGAAQPSPWWSATGWRAFGRRPEKSWRVRTGVAAACVAVACVAFVLARPWFQTPAASAPLTFTVRGQPTSIHFSEGSSFTVHPGSSAHMASVDERGATFVVEHGSFDARVMPLPEARWSVRAGPYEVHVTGTEFTTTWDPREPSLAVLLREGSVRIVGGGLPSEVELRRGQRFDGRPGVDFRVGALAEVAPEPDTAHPPTDLAQISTDSGANPADVHGPSATDEPPARRSRPSGDATTWSALVNQGQFEQVIAQAERRGLGACIASCAREDLRALADAARYTGRASVAQDSLLALRARVPQEAARAGYFLGSLGESRGELPTALEWYTRYLREAPTGALAAEARAGKMRTLVALGRRQEARAVADEYLRLHPRGVAAERARQLSSTR